MNKRVLLILALATAPAAAQQAHAPARRAEQPQAQSHAATVRRTQGEEIDPRATEILHGMSDYLGSLRSFRVNATAVDEVVLRSGEKVQLVSRSLVSVVRPNKVRADRVGPMADVVFRYDGNTFSVFGNRTRMYATAPAPNDLHGAIDAMRERLGLDLPGADLIESRPYDVLMDGVTSGRDLGLEPIEGVQCHHLAFRGSEVDWQVWIADGPQPLPMRYVITSKRVTGSPEFTLQLSSWEPNARIADDEFTFVPPPGSTQIQFLPPAVRSRTEGR